ncbi:hypothetical protein OPW36_18235 [Vibrio europaeus]|uniref:Lipoprotein n=1 Tax=Vibrio europaeus TaxID=300876 RepID=A0AAE7AZ71_9VIBR|nr:hypothetical protein [Vibrio europaeus]MDC5805258.1 hypothetical protein [Vibrio europaeus]MDC5811437.1 hypothetical protein [Vibrio europaeus]MDC5826667.1 hypothetical protein [Vibrio europaeus]MDC5832033.1 hypothetical protein [Vibrio europaeus]MDC5834988.1 hypothetical protein [Vibrio europaeus]
MKNISGLLVLFSLVFLSGCQSNALSRVDNVVTSDSMNLKILIDSQYRYIGDFESSEFYEYSDGVGGSVHDLNTMLFVNDIDDSFILLEKKTCRDCYFTPTSRVAEGDGEASFFVGSTRIYRRENGYVTLVPENDTQVQTLKLLMQVNNDGVYEGNFCDSTYVTGINSSYFQIGVFASCENESLPKVADLVSFEAL